jgi:hypothetical protein
MKSVVLGAAVAVTLTAAVPASSQVTVRDREDVIIRESPPELVSRTCRVPHDARSDAFAEW